MSDNKSKKDVGNKLESDFDIFIADSIYPDAEPIFTAKFKNITEIKDDCLVALDTNSLLIPYAIGKDSLEQIRNTYSKLVAEKRLIIPGQVGREFAKNRPYKLAELYQQFNRKTSNINKFHKGNYPLLESLEAYKKSIQLEEEIDKLITDYKKTIQSILGYISQWNWNDPVSILYSELFIGDVILDLKVNQEDVSNKLEKRILHSIPPGYKDSGKEDKGIGDFLIWLTILEAGKIHKKSMLFVSGEEKPDWFHKSEGKPLYPRYELVDEYRRYSEGQSFHIVSFSQFLDIYGADKSTVQEVREEEEKLNLEFTLIGEFIKTCNKFEALIYQKYKNVSLKEEIRKSLPPSTMIQILLKEQIISFHFFEQALKVNNFRNKTVHGHGDNISPNQIKEAILTINELIDELKMTDIE